jgi:protein transport protein SEC23
MARNPLPPHYADISPNQMPPELSQNFLTIEYILNKPPSNPPIFLYLVDTCLREEDLRSLKESIIVSLSLLPPNSLVGLITFGTMVVKLLTVGSSS